LSEIRTFDENKTYYSILKKLAFIFFYLPAMVGTPFLLKEPIDNLYPDERHYNEVCWLTAHNAFANAPDGWIYDQQTLNFDEQFEYGVRSFMIDLHWYDSSSEGRYIALCHEDNEFKKRTGNALGIGFENCFLTRGSLGGELPKPASYFFTKVDKWLRENPKSIITVHIESYLGANSAKELEKIFTETGVAEFIYNSPIGSPSSKWPTLGELRNTNKRLIIFSDNQGDKCIPVNAYRETKYNLKEFPQCELRGEGRHSSALLFVMNHFNSISFEMIDFWPGANSFIETNAYDAILSRVNICYRKENRLPNFIAVDFVESGSHGGARAVVATLNKLSPENFHHFFGLISERGDLEINREKGQPTHFEL
jgi:hypothetical protein